jgi:3-phosphoshikimate 1-carboxyvinyltransferase
MISALRILGTGVEVENPTTLKVQPGFAPFTGLIDVGPAGTTMRFLTALIATLPETAVTLSGSKRMHERPIAPLVSALHELGADIEYLGQPNCPPLKICGRHLSGNRCKVSGSTSSQFISALLMVAPRLPVGLQLEITGELVSKTYLEMTREAMEAFGVTVSSSYAVAGAASYRGCHYQIEGDASSASYLFALAALGGGPITVSGVNPRSLQGDMKFPKLLEQMGCQVEYKQNEISVARNGPLLPIECDMTLMPDTAQTLAVVAACAEGTSKITGLSTLKHKETDRLQALHQELAKVGIDSKIDATSITVKGGTPHTARVATYEDHRMAMSFAVLAAVTDSIEIEHPQVVEKSFPDFFQVLRQLGIETTEGQS